MMLPPIPCGLRMRNASRETVGAGHTLGITPFSEGTKSPSALGGQGIAAIVGADSGAVKARLFRAREKLRVRLEQYFRIGRETATVKRA